MRAATHSHHLSRLSSPPPTTQARQLSAHPPPVCDGDYNASAGTFRLSPTPFEPPHGTSGLSFSSFCSFCSFCVAATPPPCQLMISSLFTPIPKNAHISTMPVPMVSRPVPIPISVSIFIPISLPCSPVSMGLDSSRHMSGCAPHAWTRQIRCRHRSFP